MTELKKSSLFVDLLDAPFSRRGSYLVFAADNHGEDLFGKCTLWLATCKTSASMDFNQPNGFRQVKLELVRDGRVLPCVISTTSSEVILDSNHGQVRFTIGERCLAMASGSDGLTLRLTPRPSFTGLSVITIRSGARVVDFGPEKLALTAIKGGFAVAPGFIDLEPDENGALLLAMEDFCIDPVTRPLEEYPDYDGCVRSYRADFEAFCARVCPSLPRPYEPKRLQALWQTWSMTVEPGGDAVYRRSMVKMIHGIFEGAFAWQQPMQSIWLSGDIRLAWTLLCSCFDLQDANGRIADGISFRSGSGFGMKPPVQGLALLWLMDNRDLSWVPVEEKEWLYKRLTKWTDYFFNLRDVDGDGLIEAQTAMETGWEDAPYYNVGFPNASPDLNALLALQLEAQSRLAAELGHPEAEQLLERSRQMVTRLTDAFWDGEKWFAFNAETKRRSDSRTVALYIPLLLGSRLPRDIIEKSIAALTEDGGFMTPYGIASEALTSDYFAHGFTRGSIITPAQFLMTLALEACGRADLAAQIGRGYASILRDHGFFHIHNAITGREDRTLTAFTERGLFWSAWASSCYLYMAERYGE